MLSYTHHKDYKTCDSCGANLDHGESCHCEDDETRDKIVEVIQEVIERAKEAVNAIGEDLNKFKEAIGLTWSELAKLWDKINKKKELYTSRKLPRPPKRNYISYTAPCITRKIHRVQYR